jgi:3-deoxy-D-arabino-heptulosonate 7-phosphate (DAHP) synthase class II
VCRELRAVSHDERRILHEELRLLGIVGDGDCVLVVTVGSVASAAMVATVFAMVSVFAVATVFGASMSVVTVSVVAMALSGPRAASKQERCSQYN